MRLFRYFMLGIALILSLGSASDSDLKAEKPIITNSILNYSSLHIGDDSVVNALPQLKRLSAIVEEILEANDQTPVKELKLNNNVIGDWGAKFLADHLFSHLQQLEILNLSNNWITEGGVKYVASLLQPSIFKYLVITDNYGATIHGLNNLRNELAVIRTFHTFENLLKKVIWVKEEDIDSFADAYLLPWQYARAHHHYYQQLRGQNKLVIRDLYASEIIKAISSEIISDLKSSIYNKEPFISLAHNAAEDSESAYLIGKEYYSGTKLKRNYTKAAEWFTLAAKKGHVKAIEELAVLYRSGFLPVTKKLLAESKAFMEEAARRGEKLAMNYND